MIDFKKIEISDKEWVSRILAFSDYRGAEYNFTNLYIWDGIYKSEIGRFKDFLIIRTGIQGERSYLYPPGRGDKREVLDEIVKDASYDESNFSLIGITRDTKAELEKMFPHTFRFKLVRDSFDYIYDADKLATLSGKKLQPKRNHLNHFNTNYNWSYEEFTAGKVAQVKEFSHEWCRRMDCKKIETLSWETCAVEKCLDNFEELNMKGGILLADGEIVAYTVGEVLNSDTIVVHIEKAFSEVRGAYPMINREFVKRNAPGFKYVNREDDIGDEGLRKAKESYYPSLLLEKFSATLI